VWDGVPVRVQVTALWRPGADRAALRAAAESYAGGLVRLCPRCASADHGRPRPARGPGHVSLAYGPGVVLLARAQVPVGVDLERDDGRPPGVDGVPDLAAWTRVEAVLKATGEGLARDPGSVRDDEAATAPLPLPSGWVGTVAVLDAGPVRVEWGEG